MSDQKLLDELIKTLNLEKLEENLFRGQSEQTAWGRVFGGQVIGQALSATQETVDNSRKAHSLHAYFLRPGRIDMPILYDVQRIRDGKSFTTRTVNAIQNGEYIFNMSVSFKISEERLEHQFEMPDVPSPEELKSDREFREEMKDKIPKAMLEGFLRDKPIEIRNVENLNPFDNEKGEPFKNMWIKASGKLPDNHLIHQGVLAYASDMGLLGTSQRPHGFSFGAYEKLQVASLDHAMWFHREFRADEWLLYSLDSPSASNANGFNRGNIFTQDGKLVASAVQEGLIRVKDK